MKCWNYVIEKKFFLENKKDDIQDGMNYQIKGLQKLLMLREDERCFIYQHVFEERTFKEISCLNEVKEDKVKSIYYYAIHKIRKWMGGD